MQGPRLAAGRATGDLATQQLLQPCDEVGVAERPASSFAVPECSEARIIALTALQQRAEIPHAIEQRFGNTGTANVLQQFRLIMQRPRLAAGRATGDLATQQLLQPCDEVGVAERPASSFTVSE